MKAKRTLQRTFASILLIGILIVGLVFKQARLAGAQTPMPPSPSTKEWTNSIGMKFIRIKPGTFMMGSNNGDWDEGNTTHLRAEC